MPNNEEQSYLGDARPGRIRALPSRRYFRGSQAAGGLLEGRQGAAAGLDGHRQRSCRSAARQAVTDGAAA